MPDFTTTKRTSYPGITRRPRDYALPGIVGEDTLAGPDGVLRGNGVLDVTESVSGFLIDGDVPVVPGRRIDIQIDYDPEGSVNAFSASDALTFMLVTADNTSMSVREIQETEIRMAGTSVPRRHMVSFVSSGIRSDMDADAPSEVQRYFQLVVGPKSGTYNVKLKIQYHIHPLNT